MWFHVKICNWNPIISNGSSQSILPNFIITFFPYLCCMWIPQSISDVIPCPSPLACCLLWPPAWWSLSPGTGTGFWRRSRGTRAADGRWRTAGRRGAPSPQFYVGCGWGEVCRLWRRHRAGWPDPVLTEWRLHGRAWDSVSWELITMCVVYKNYSLVLVVRNNFQPDPLPAGYRSRAVTLIKCHQI